MAIVACASSSPSIANAAARYRDRRCGQVLWMGTSRVWLITGASSGLGRALAEASLEQGDRVVATARDPSTVADLEDRYRGRAIATRLDVTDPSQARASVGAALAAFDGLDVVVTTRASGC
jgi:NAD(P)-dependent dehydrogenase (short-subunit alcohol dehydrogenase family)